MAKRAPVLLHSEESERAILGALLLDPSQLGTVRGRLEPPDFYAERNRLVYTAMLAVTDAGSALDLRTLQAQLELAGAIQKVGGLAYLATLDLDLPDIGSVAEYVEIVKERALRRSLVRAAQAAIKASLESEKPAGEIATGLMSAGEALARTASRARWRHAGAVADEILQRIEDAEGPALEGLPTGFPDWDRLGPGLLPGNLVIIAGRPGMGKTSFAMDLARHIAGPEKVVGVFSIEQPCPELGLKLLSAESDLAARSIRRGYLSTQQWRTLFAAAGRLRNAQILLDDSPDLVLKDLESRAGLLRQQHPGLALLIVDYLQLVGAGVKAESRRLEVALVARRLKQLAGKLGLPIVALSQLNRDVEKRSDPRPVLPDLAESGNIEQDADQVAFVHRPEVYSPEDQSLRGLAEIIVAKHRHGETGTFELIWSGSTTSFRPRVLPQMAGPDPF